MACNRIGLEKSAYKGSPSTLCTGCGHDSITSHIMSALFKLDIHPHNLVKLSGIGCSSKTPTYFSSESFGFNSLHGRMAPLATGVGLSNRRLKILGISGDGDSASIGLGGFVHLLRRNLPMVYIVENNGVYGLTKGQFSATADENSLSKSGEASGFETLDLCSLAISVGCGFVARSFSGSAKQLVPLLEAAFKYNGTAFIDVISPCVTFANHEGSTKSYNSVKEHMKSLQDVGFVPEYEEIIADESQNQQIITLHDGSHLVLKSLDENTHDTSNSLGAIKVLTEAHENKEIITGLFYLDSKKQNLFQTMKLGEEPLVKLKEQELKLKQSDLDRIMEDYT